MPILVQEGKFRFSYKVEFVKKYFLNFRPFLEFKPVSGSFQVNPPHVEELIDAALMHIDKLLMDSIEPLRLVFNFLFSF